MSLRLYRIYNHRADYARAASFNPLDGVGGLSSASRWNLAGYPVLYTSSSAALALAEMLVHIPAAIFGERTLLSLEITVEVSLETVTNTHLLQLLRDASPDNPLDTTQAFGNQWLEEGRTLLLKVPSIPLPFEHNYLINPRHPEMKQVTLLDSAKIYLDKRITTLNTTERKS
jgi:RES domain-containing protein